MITAVYVVVGTDAQGRATELLSRGYLVRAWAEEQAEEERRVGRYSSFPGQVAVDEASDLPDDLLLELVEAGLAWDVRQVSTALREHGKHLLAATLAARTCARAAMTSPTPTIHDDPDA